MSNFEMFMKKNKVEKAHTFYPATKSLLDENGQPLLWELKSVTSKESDRLLKECTRRKIDKRGNVSETTDNNLYINMLLCLCKRF